MKATLKQQIDFALASALDALTPPRNSEEAHSVTMLANARAALAEEPVEKPAPLSDILIETWGSRKPLPWHVVTISRNTGSFGHKSVLVLNEHGEGRELLLQAYGSDPLPVVGQKLDRLPQSEVSPRALPSTTPAKAKKIIAALPKI